MKKMKCLVAAFLCAFIASASIVQSNASAKHQQFQLEQKQQPWYVKDALVVHFDGLFNTGKRGQHSSDTSYWVDLVSQCMMPIARAYDNCVSFQSSTVPVLSQPGIVKYFTADHDFTLHTVVTTPVSSPSWTMQALIAFGRSSFNKNGFVLGGIAGYSSFQAFYSSAYSGGTKLYVDTNRGANVTFVLDIVFYYNTLQFTAYVDGVQLSEARQIPQNAWNLDGQSDISIAIGANSGALNDASGFRQHSIILYSKALSLEEVQYNYNIDKMRFGL